MNYLISRYEELPRPSNSSALLCDFGLNSNSAFTGGASTSSASTTSIAQYFTPANCVVCGEPTVKSSSHSNTNVSTICQSCKNQPQKTTAELSFKIREYERTIAHINEVIQIFVFILFF